MSQPIIQVEHLSKQYRLGEVGTGTLSHDLKRWWYKVRGKEDPFARIGEVNDRSTKGDSEYVWALKDINFSVQPGEVVGIIGRNGAGKSTLLKILSKTTAPTTGRIKVRGRIASLLEVGTGFHPELTGRENIYLNGAILGMTRREINRQFDAIVDFAGVERYVDTPVKRYSSGMYVRLAFAVAAHLEPEILIVDEVLAVGDAEFQKKCLGKMKDVSVQDGRTVLFVSHNMAAVKQLCKVGILLSNGEIRDMGDVDAAIKEYQKSVGLKKSINEYENKRDVGFVKKILINKNIFEHDDHVEIKIELNSTNINFTGLFLGVAFYDQWKRKLFTTQKKIDVNKNFYILKTPNKLFLSGQYSVDVAVFIPNGSVFEYLNEIISFYFEDTNSEFAIYENNDIGALKINCHWS
jgi:lipopolysaccharide transport system ATP-binding protein